MDRIKTILCATAVVAALATSAQAQNCNTCNKGFGYPSQGNGPLYNARANFNGYVDMAKVAFKRNQAWPKPFECMDRRSYVGSWAPMYNRGLESHCRLTDAHFDPKTNELNSAGKSKIAGIMANLPTASRNIYVFQGNDQTRAQERLAEVQAQVGQWFGHLPEPAIAMTTNPFYGQAGNIAERINAQFVEGMSAPVIPTGGGGGAGGGN